MDRAEFIFLFNEVESRIKSFRYMVTYIYENIVSVESEGDVSGIRPFIYNALEMHSLDGQITEICKYLISHPQEYNEEFYSRLKDMQDTAIYVITWIGERYKYLGDDEKSKFELWGSEVIDPISILFENIKPHNPEMENPGKKTNCQPEDEKQRADLLRGVVEYKYDSDKVGELVKELSRGKRGSETACVLIAFIRMSIIKPGISYEKFVGLGLGNISEGCFSEYIISKRSETNKTLRAKYSKDMEDRIGEIKTHIRNHESDIKIRV